MTHTHNVTPLSIIPVYQRYVDIDEDIHQCLTLQSLSLYMAFRFCAQFGQEASRVKRTAKYMWEKAKIRRSQYFKSMNELENVGLILRDPSSEIGKVAIIHIARHLYHFKPELAPKPVLISPSEEPVHMVDGGVHTVDTLFINSSHEIPTTSNSQDSKPKLSRKEPSHPPILKEMIEAYRETFPDNPQPHPKVISTSLEKTLQTFIKRWPEHDPEGKAMTLDSFRRYMVGLKTFAPKFSLGAYVTPEGNRKKNSLETFCRWNTLVKFLENSYT